MSIKKIYADKDYVQAHVIEKIQEKIDSLPTPDVSGQIASHNIDNTAHDDIRDLIEGLTTRLNTLADSDDTTLDQLSEIVSYIKNNKTLIEGVTSNKVNVTDIVDNLTSTTTNKPLSAAQGKALKDLIDTLDGSLATKVDKVSGKGLSTNDFTTALKNKLDGIAIGATANTGTITGVTAGTGLSGGGTSGAVTLNHSNSITAGTIGSAASPTNGGTFSIPSITYDAQGHITQATTATITLPSISASDTKVTQTIRTTNGNFPLLLRGTSGGATTTTTTTTFASAITANPSTGIITATGFAGSGTSLTALNASNISSGTIAAARLPAATTSALGATYLPTISTTDPGVGSTLTTGKLYFVYEA